METKEKFLVETTKGHKIKISLLSENLRLLLINRLRLMNCQYYIGKDFIMIDNATYDSLKYDMT